MLQTDTIVSLSLFLVIMAQVCAATRGDEGIIYVRANESQSCPSSVVPCLSLADYFYNSSHYFASHTTVKFLRGEHTINGSGLLDGTFVLSELSNFTLLGKNISNGDQPVVRTKCIVPVQFVVFKKTTSLRIHNIEFTDCGVGHSENSFQRDQRQKRMKAALEFHTVRTLEEHARLGLSLECIATEQLVFSVNLLPYPIGLNLSGDPPQCDCAAHLKEMLTGITCNINSPTLRLQNDFWARNVVGHPKSEVRPKQQFSQYVSDHSRSSYSSDYTHCTYATYATYTSHSNSNIRFYLLLMIQYVIAGIPLVIFLKLCDLTVFRGTINGLIFFANIIHVNRKTFFSHPNTLLMRVLATCVAWLNLDFEFGSESYFFEDMHMIAFTKGVVQFVFPVFICSLLGLAIYSSRHSITISRLIGTNAVEVLATLFLLSYVKLLRLVFLLCFSYFMLHYMTVV